MTRTESLLYRRRYLLWVVAALLALGGGLAVAFLQIDRAEQRAVDLATEADRRGDAVSTLATDVRTLRAQITARGETPAAPDPAAAIDDLPGRAAVPVPIPGPPGARGEAGRTGATGPPGAAATGAPGADGAPGAPGPAVTGPAGADGRDGSDGAAGKDGRDGADGAPGPRGPAGPSCPDGYSLQPPPGDPDGLMCRRTSTPPTSPDPATPTSSPAALAPERRRP
ncbi:collagen-like domain-containing protein [[Kitasatospora] papulosa]|uniref:collagen-like protein n=1 Tax=[Kitasatospora] papulosa TaxID=1464011 RepID=UPI0036BEFCD4